MLWPASFIVERLTDPQTVDHAAVNQAFEKKRGIVFQFSKNYPSPQLIAEIEALAKVHPEHIGLRFYGFERNTFDCEKIGPLNHIKRLSVDCLNKAAHFEALSQYRLNYLSLHSHQGMPPNLLSLVDSSELKTLFVTEGKTKLDLAPLAAMSKLERLSILGASKGIDAIAALKNLNWLQLMGVKKTGFAFIQKLSALETLYISLGGRTNLNDIENPALRYVQIIRIQGLNDLSVIQRSPNIEWLLIEDQLQLKELTLPAKGSKLQNMIINNCRNLSRLSGLKAARNLERLRLIKTALDFDSVQSQLPPTIKNFAFYTGKKKQDDAFDKRLQQLGYQTSYR